MTPEHASRVLIVDDEPDNLLALEAVLEPLERELVRAGSGEEALGLLLRDEFALILLDVRMPGLDGFETAALIKQRDRTRHVPIIFITGQSKDTEQVFRGYSEGAVDYLLKPYDPAVLRSKVSVFLELHEKGADLEESEQRFRTAFANAPSGMALLTPDGRFLQANRALADMVGRTQSDLVGEPWDSIVHPDERAEDRAALRGLVDGTRSVYRVRRRCLHADGRPVATALSMSPPVGHGTRGQQLIVQIEDVTERERAELERAERLRERAARAEAEAVAQVTRNVQRVSDAALEHLTLDDLLPELVDRVAEILGADSVSVLLKDPDAGMFVPRATRGAGPLGPDGFVERIAEEGRPVVISADGGSLMGAALVADGEVSGVVCVGSAHPDRFDNSDAALLGLVADRAALAIGNASMYERERGIVETLQRSLLPARLPQRTGMSLAARYLPGGSDVGGDWYDAIELDDGGVGLAMGDVVGHGIDAAAKMGELRNALRAYALEGLSPGEVLGRLDHLIERLDGELMATAVYLVIDADWTEVRFASAGHPPAMVLRPDGGAEFLWDGRSPLLGVRGYGEHEEGTSTLAPGSTLALYTDGLVEVRGEDLLDGLDRLRDAIVAGPDDPDALCDHVIESLLGSRPASDDVAFLALRTLPLPDERLQLELSTDPASLRYVRRTLGRWLAQAGATEGEAWELELASTEAIANSIEHAYRFGDAHVKLDAALDDGVVTLTVSDAGGWRESNAEGRGKGMELMRGLMDDVNVQGGPHGTRIELRRRLSEAGKTHPSRA